MNDDDQRPKTKDQKPIDWDSARRILVIRLRSIGDTVLSTPSLIAMRRFLPEAQIDVLLEEWVAPLLDNFTDIDNVIRVGKSEIDRLKVAWQLRRNSYDVVFNLHGGTTSTMLARATGASHRVGYEEYQYSSFYTHKPVPSSEFWKREKTHSAEQQLALLGGVGVPVQDLPRTRLDVSLDAVRSLAKKFEPDSNYALLHPASLFHTKQWSAKDFACVAEYLAGRGFKIAAVASSTENAVLDALRQESAVPINIFDDLSLPEITALASGASVFVGNDSGVAHIAAAVNTPTVVIFGSSNRDHWRPWTDAANEIVFNRFECQPCPGYECAVYGEPKCILSVSSDQVIAAIDRVLAM